MPTPDSNNPFVEIMNVAGKVDPGALVTLWANLPPHPPGFTGDLFDRFDDIDRDGDGFISREEIDMVCSDPVFTGQQAAAIAALRRVLHELEEISNDEVGWENDGVTRADIGGFDLVAQANPDDEFVNEANATYEIAKAKIERSPRSAFRDGEAPTVEPLRCQQGLMGDCFFLAPLISLAHQDSRRLLSMINVHPTRPHTWQVRFPGSERAVSVSMPTEAQIALFSIADGLWSAIFEIAYGRHVYRDKYGALTRLEAVHGGYVEDAVSALTGAPANVLATNDVSMAEMRDCLEDAMSRDKVVAAATKPRMSKDEEKKDPSVKFTEDGLARSHAYSILGFGGDVALVRNPWGGTRGGMKGQDVKNGVFTMSLACFHRNFMKIVIER